MTRLRSPAYVRTRSSEIAEGGYAMSQLEIRAALDGAPEFVADAVAHLAVCLGQDHPTVVAGRRIMASLDAFPDGAVLVTEESLAAALQQRLPIPAGNYLLEPRAASTGPALVWAPHEAPRRDPRPRKHRPPPPSMFLILPIVIVA